MQLNERIYFDKKEGALVFKSGNEGFIIQPNRLGNSIANKDKSKKVSCHISSLDELKDATLLAKLTTTKNNIPSDDYKYYNETSLIELGIMLNKILKCNSIEEIKNLFDNKENFFEKIFFNNGRDDLVYNLILCPTNNNKDMDIYLKIFGDKGIRMSLKLDTSNEIRYLRDSIYKFFKFICFDNYERDHRNMEYRVSNKKLIDNLYIKNNTIYYDEDKLQRTFEYCFVGDNCDWITVKTRDSNKSFNIENIGFFGVDDEGRLVFKDSYNSEKSRIFKFYIDEVLDIELTLNLLGDEVDTLEVDYTANLLFEKYIKNVKSIISDFKTLDVEYLYKKYETLFWKIKYYGPTYPETEKEILKLIKKKVKSTYLLSAFLFILISSPPAAPPINVL